MGLNFIISDSGFFHLLNPEFECELIGLRSINLWVVLILFVLELSRSKVEEISLDYDLLIRINCMNPESKIEYRVEISAGSYSVGLV